MMQGRFFSAANRSIRRVLSHHPASCFSAASFVSSSASAERPRRSLFSVPGADQRKIAKAQGLKADAVVLDLEDGVAYDKKDDARELVRQTLGNPSQDFGSAEICVRINSLDTNDTALRDLEAVLPCSRLQAVVVPKVERASDVIFVSRMIDSLCEVTRDVRIIAGIESAIGVLNLREIAEASKEGSSNAKLDALVFASEDFCADIEATRTESATEMLFARSQLVIAAKAFGLQAIDMVHINFRDLDGLKVECEGGRQMGFTGKQAIHPTQIDIINELFAPSATEIIFASLAVQEYESTTAKGEGACVVDGIVVDMPVYKWSKKIVERAAKAGMM
jgi:citrate lyase subunit beta-like protein